jgi:dynein heavy chain
MGDHYLLFGGIKLQGKKVEPNDEIYGLRLVS